MIYFPDIYFDIFGLWPRIINAEDIVLANSPVNSSGCVRP